MNIDCYDFVALYRKERSIQTLLFMKDEIICSNMYNMEHTKRDFLNYNETINNEHTHIMQIFIVRRVNQNCTICMYRTCDIQNSVSLHAYAAPS